MLIGPKVGESSTEELPIAARPDFLQMLEFQRDFKQIVEPRDRMAQVLGLQVRFKRRLIAPRFDDRE